MNLTKYEETTDLIDFLENHELFRATPETYHSWRKMKDAAAKDGIELILVSAYRSIKRQQELVEEKRRQNISDNEIFKVLAQPGYSEHHTGRALDLHTPKSALLEEDFEFSKAFAWMQENGSKFGFYMSYPRNNKYNMAYEPWHWCLKK